MDILGIGGWELVAIVAIMLVVAGPKRMIAWSYTAGQYMAKLRLLWSETAQQLQHEFDAAGVEVKVPQQIPTRATLNRDLARVLTPVTKPLTEARDEMRAEMKSATTVERIAPPKRPPAFPATKPVEIAPENTPMNSPAAPDRDPVPHEAASYGTWAGR